MQNFSCNAASIGGTEREKETERGRGEREILEHKELP